MKIVAALVLAVACAGCAGPVERASAVTTVATEQGFKLSAGELAFCGLTRIEQPQYDMVCWVYVGPSGKMALVAMNTKTGQIVASSSMNREDAMKIAREEIGAK